MNGVTGQFAGQASNVESGGEIIDGTITLDRTHFYFNGPSLELRIRLAQLGIIMEEVEEGRIRFADELNPIWEIACEDLSILESRLLLGMAHTRYQIRAYRGKREYNRHLRLALYFVGGFAVVALLFYLAIGLMVQSLLARIPPAWEKQIGSQAMDELKQEVVFVQQPKLRAKLDWAVAPLLKSLPNGGTNYEFYLIEHPLPNAFALPGGYVVVTTSLLELADRPEEIAGVISHEVAHVTRKHGFRMIISSAGPYLIFKLFSESGSGLLGMLGSGSGLLASQSFSQEYELEADATGWQTMVNAHLDPRGLPDMLKKLQNVYESYNFSEHEFQAFSSHPPTNKRIRVLEAKWKKLKDTSNFQHYPPDPSQPGNGSS